MIYLAKNRENLAWLFEFLHDHAGVTPTEQMHAIGWIEDNRRKVVVGFDGWIGKTCQMHVAFEPGYHFSPRAMLAYCFRHAFIGCAREMVLGVVNSKNDRALKYDLHLGFREVGRIKGVHDDGGDIVVLGMRREECRYLDEPKLYGEEHAGVTGHA